MKHRIRLLVLILALVLVLVPTVGIADMGGFSGDSDYGGSDWGSSDWGSSDWGSSDWGSSDWDSSSSGIWYDSSSSNSSSDGDFMSTVIGAVVIGVIILLIYSRMASKKKHNTSVAPGAVATNQSLLQPVSTLIAQDPAFSEAAFCEKLSNYYVQMQNAWTAKNMSSVRHLFTDSLFAQFDRQLDVLRQTHRTNYVDRISVLGVRVMGWMQDDVNDVIIARLQTRIVDYVLDDATGNLVQGDRSKEKFLDYEWKLVRTKGKKTEQTEGTTQLHCNSCGAVVDVNRSAKCEYCGAIITTSDYDWVISAIKGISQRTS